jgi:hypothetical protein
VSEIVFTTFAQVQSALQTFVTTHKIPIAGAQHGNFWNTGATKMSNTSILLRSQRFLASRF